MVVERGTKAKNTDKESSDLAEKILDFRDGLPADQRRILSTLVGGAIATDDLSSGDFRVNESGEAFLNSLARFEASLPQAQRQGFTALLMAGALAWGQSSDPMPEEDQKPVALIWVHVARTAAVLIAGAITVIREGTEDDEEIVVPCVTCDLPT